MKLIWTCVQLLLVGIPVYADNLLEPYQVWEGTETITFAGSDESKVYSRGSSGADLCYIFNRWVLRNERDKNKITVMRLMDGAPDDVCSLSPSREVIVANGNLLGMWKQFMMVGAVGTPGKSSVGVVDLQQKKQIYKSVYTATRPPAISEDGLLLFCAPGKSKGDVTMEYDLLGHQLRSTGDEKCTARK